MNSSRIHQNCSMIKKNKILSSALSIGAVTAVLIINLILSPKSDTFYEKIEVQGSVMEYDYESLKNEADIIALIECRDDINKKNSTVYKDNDFVVGFSSKRNVNVLKTYKGKNIKNLNILEPAALTEKNELLYIEDYDIMKKGEKYIVFLSDDTLTGGYSIISGNNGKISFTNINKNEYFDIAFKSIVDLESDVSFDEKKEIISSTVVNDKKIKKDETIEVDDINANIDINLDYKEKNGIIYAEIN